MLFHLSNLSPRLNKVCVKRDKFNNKSKKNESADTLSSLVSLRNDLIELFKNEFNESTKNMRKFCFDISLTNPIDKILIKTSTVWSPSNCYISSGSFNSDKNSSAFVELEGQNHFFANGGLNRVNRLEINFLNKQQVRAFKTYRSLISDNQRNPTILSRLKEAYNQPGSGKNPGLSGQPAQSVQNESLTKLLNQADLSNLTPEQKQQLKVAFAEGYLAAAHPDNAKKDSRALKYLKIFQQLLIIAVFMGIFASFFASNSGSVFR